MLTKVISENFELDLSNYPFTTVEENNWLNDKLLSKISYPVEVDLTPEQVVALNNITEFNIDRPQSRFEVEFYTMGQEHEAILEIQKIVGKRALLQIYYGLEEFPNFSKNLSELPLEKSDVAGDFYTFAEGIISQSWPDVNYNFPQVITDQLDTDSDQWQSFLGVINNYAANNFIQNDYDAQNDIQNNRNVMQPLPYLLHIFKQGFLDAGYSLEGSILEDPDFIRATVYKLSDYYFGGNSVQENYSKKLDEYDNLNGRLTEYSEVITFPEPGRYKIAGNIILNAKRDSDDFLVALGKISYNGNRVWYSQIFRKNSDTAHRQEFFTVNVNVDFSGSEGDMLFESVQNSYAFVNGEKIYDANIMDITVTQLAKFDAQGNLIPTLVTPSKIDLTQTVPDMTFGEFVTAHTKWRNYGIDINGKVVTISKKKTLIEADTKAFNLTDYEVEFPERYFNQGKSFTLGFFDFQSDLYKYQSVFIDATGFKLSPYDKNDDTTEIVINAIPLPLKQQGDIVTAHGFLDDDSKAMIVLYDGLTGGLNLAQNADQLRIPAIYETDHQDWFNFLLSSVRFVWSFSCFYEQIIDLRIKSIIYAYNQFHIIRRLTRKNINENVASIEIETETLE